MRAAVAKLPLALIAALTSFQVTTAMAVEPNAAALYAERCGICHSGAPAKFLGATLRWKSDVLVLKDDDTTLRDFLARHGRQSSDEADLLTAYIHTQLKKN